MARRWILVCVCSGLAALAGHRTSSPTRTPLQLSKQSILKQFNAMPLAFEANVGQTSDAASFVARGQGYAVWATAQGPVLRLRNRQASNGAVLRMRVVGGDLHSHPSAETLLPGRANYFLGNEPSRWKTNVARFQALRYDEVYPGVDLVLHGTQESLEYDFDVAPHTDPSQIAVKFDGATSVRIEPTGDLTLSVADGELGFHAPVAYQDHEGTRQMVAARYDVDADNVVRFAIGEYDSSRPLTIDPVLSYSTYLGGTVGNFGIAGNDLAYALAVDVFGNAYLAGFTSALDFPTPGAPWDTTCGGCTNSGGDVWVAKIDPAQSGAASLVFATYLGSPSTGSGTGSSTAYGVAVDGTGNVYVTGNTGALDDPNTPLNEAFPTTPTAFQFNRGSSLDAFLTKLNPTGSALLYSTYIGGNNVDEGSAIKVDNAGHAYVAGWSASSDFPGTATGFKTTNSAFQFDGFVLKIDTTKSGLAAIDYGTLVGGGSQDRIGALALDALGRVYVTGLTQSTGVQPFPVLNGFQTVSLGGQDSFMTMINPSVTGAPSLVYSTLISSNGTENGAQQEGGIAIDAFGMVYVTGSTYGASPATSFPTTPGAYKTVVESSDAYVVKIDPTQAGAASLVASTLVGGQFQDGGTGVAIDQFNNPVLVGWSSGMTVTACALPLSGSVDGYIMVLDPSLGSATAATRFGGSGTDRIYAVGIGPLNQIYVAGYTESTNFPTSVDSATTKAAYDTTVQGQDAFVSVITSLADPTCAMPVATGQSVTTAEDTPKGLTLSATDADGNKVTPDALTWKVISAPAHGNLDISAGEMLHGAGPNYTTAVTYTPAANYAGPDSFTFRVYDGWFTSATATVNITITAVNDPPNPGADSASTSEDVPVTVAVLANDTDPENNTLSVTNVSCSNAIATINVNKTVTVSPALNFNGTVTCTYTLSDGNSTANGTLTVTVAPVNDSPTANNDTALTSEDQPVMVNVLANDTDADGDALSVTAGACTNGGSAAVNPDKTITVTPPLNFSGTIVCGYGVNDGNGGSANASLSVTVTAVNDNPTAGGDTASTAEDTPVIVAVLANDSDVDGDSLQVTLPSCDNGLIQVNPDKTVTVTPSLNFYGTVTCSYTVSDGHGGTATASLVVSVNAVNDTPIASPDFDSTDDNTLKVVNVLGNDTDPDAGDTLSLGPTVTCQVGTATPNWDGTINYQPVVGFGGIDTCTYTVSDIAGATASGLLTMTVTEVNDVPTLDNPGDQLTDEGTAVSLQLTANDADGDALAFGATGLPPGLTIDPATGLISGSPDAGAAGSYSVTVTVDDGKGGTRSVTFTWVVTPPPVVDVNQPPACSAAYPSAASLLQPNHQLVPIQILGVTDPDGGQPAITITRILQDEPTNTVGDANTWIDGFGVGTSTAQIRAERTGTPKVPGDGRVYEISFSATDTHGASCTGTVFVGVPHDQAHGTAVDSIVRYDSTVAGGQPINKP